MNSEKNYKENFSKYLMKLDESWKSVEVCFENTGISF